MADMPASSRQEGRWASPVEHLHVQADGGEGGDARAVEGRGLVGPLNGFGRLWQKTYRVRIGSHVTPEEVVAAWKADFGAFWPEGNRFHAPLAGITPGEVALISGRAPGGVTLSTGVYVIYADARSFSYMNPEGHPWAGMITFSADDDGDVTAAQVQLLIRAYDPLVEVGMALGGHRMEDRIWIHTLSAVARHFGAEDPEVDKVIVRVDRRRQWKHVGNWKRSSALYPVRRLAHRRSR